MDAYGGARRTRVHRTNAAAHSRLVLSSKPCRHKAGRQNFTEAEQICLRKFTLRLYLYLAMQGVCHPFPLDSLKGCVGAEAIPIYCLCILATLRHISAQAHPQLVPYLPYRSRQHSRLWLECFPPQRTSVSVATASATSFLSSAVMYLWGQLSYIRRYCRRVFRVVVSHFGSL